VIPKHPIPSPIRSPLPLLSPLPVIGWLFSGKRTLICSWYLPCAAPTSCVTRPCVRQCKQSCVVWCSPSSQTFLLWNEVLHFGVDMVGYWGCDGRGGLHTWWCVRRRLTMQLWTTLPNYLYLSCLHSLLDGHGWRWCLVLEASMIFVKQTRTQMITMIVCIVSFLHRGLWVSLWSPSSCSSGNPRPGSR
jgi:hypothetical protein